MAKLTAEQQAQLEELERLRDAPDEPAGSGQNVSITIDLSDEKAVRRALKLGLLTRGELDEFDEETGEDGDGDGDGGEEGDGDGEPDPAPKRRLNLADRTMGAK